MVFNRNKFNRKLTDTWKLNSALLNDNMVKEEKKNSKTYKNENKVSTYPNLWHTMKILRRKLIALSASKKELERACISALTVHLKPLEQKETNDSRGVDGRK